MNRKFSGAAPKVALVVSLVAALLCCSFGAHAMDSPTAAQSDRLIVHYRTQPLGARESSAALGPALAPAARQWGLELHPLRQTHNKGHVLKLSRSLDIAQAQQLAEHLRRADASVESVEVDRRLVHQMVPNDQLFHRQWHYNDPQGGINLPAAWNQFNGSGIVVGVVDTGVRPHADLLPNLLAGHDFITNAQMAADGSARDGDASDAGDWAQANECGIGTSARPSSWHGTHVAGTIAASTNNGVGVAGVAWGAKLLPLRALGKCGGNLSDIADAVVWGSGGTVPGLPKNPHPARVLNLSLGGPGDCADSKTLQSAFRYAQQRGVVTVVAAGNSQAQASGFSPANCPGALVVAAINREGTRAFYSNFGTIVDIAAPGGDVNRDGGIWSTLNSGATQPAADAYAALQGTSMAAPHVSGVVALMLQADPQLSPADVQARLKATSRPFPQSCNGCGAGIVNAHAAVNNLPTLVVNTSGTGTGTVSSDGAGLQCASACWGNFSIGQTVTIRALAAPGSVFKSWSGACSGTSPVCVLPVKARSEVGAQFLIQPKTKS